MKKQFQTRIEAVNWIADIARDEGHFEVMREQMNFNHIYTGQYYLELEEKEKMAEVVWLGGK